MPNIALIGAGSASFAVELIRDLIATPGLRGSHMSLMDIDAKRLKVSLNIAERYRNETGAKLTFSTTTDRKAALKGADFVICAVKNRGWSGLLAERRIAAKHGYEGGIGDGVWDYYGGVGAFYQFDFLMSLARDMERMCPDAWLVQTANPVFEGTNLLTRHARIKVVGVCHGHFAVRRIVDALGWNKEEFSFHVAGFNHCIWLTHVLRRGKDAYPLIDKWIATKAKQLWKTGKYHEQVSPGAVDAYRLYGLFPIGGAIRSVSPWWHHTDFKTKCRWYGPEGGFDSRVHLPKWMKIVADGRKKWDKLAEQPKVSLLERYPLEKTGKEQHIPVIDAIVNDKETKLQLNIPNNGCIDGLPDDVLVEIPVIVDGRGLRGVRVGALPPRLMNHVIVPRMLRMENLHNAYVNRDRKSLVLSLMSDHRTRAFEQAKGLVDKLLAQPWNAEADRHYRW